MKPETIEADAQEVLAARSERVLIGGASVNAAPWFLFEQLGRALFSLVGAEAQEEVTLREQVDFESTEVLVLRRRGATIELIRPNGERLFAGPTRSVVEAIQEAFQSWQTSYPARVKSPLIKAFVTARLASLDVFAGLLTTRSNEAAIAAAKSPLDLYQRVVGLPFPFALDPTHVAPCFCGSMDAKPAGTFERALLLTASALKGTTGFSLSVVGRHLLYVSATPERTVVAGDILLYDANTPGSPNALHHALLFLRDFAAQIEGSFGLIEGRLLRL